MRKSIYLVLFLALVGFSCEEKDDPISACGVSDPIENLPWLAAKKEAVATGPMSEYSYIVQATYDDQTVFYVGLCCPTCNTVIILYDCSGNALEGDVDLNAIKDGKVIWQPENVECLFD